MSTAWGSSISDMEHPMCTGRPRQPPPHTHQGLWGLLRRHEACNVAGSLCNDTHTNVCTHTHTHTHTKHTHTHKAHTHKAHTHRKHIMTHTSTDTQTHKHHTLTEHTDTRT